jgi:NADH-quinone oxidoreductase subunit B
MDLNENPAVIALNSDDLLSKMRKGTFNSLKKVGIEKAVNKLLGNFFYWGRSNSPWPLHFGIKCCALEMMTASGARYDAERLSIVYRSSPRQCDILLVTGPISKKLQPKLFTLYEQMPAPKWVIAMGECAISGGSFWESYSVVPGVDTFLPVDIYIPGCPPRPEALLDGFEKLKEKIRTDKEDIFKLE